MTAKTIGVITSGGDGPGMNACIRAIVRTAEAEGHRVLGFNRGYAGIIAGDARTLGSRDVSNILQRGGTIIRSARCKEFETGAGQEKAAMQLEKLGVDALIVIGGNGSLQGLDCFSQKWPGQVIGLPGTIDNDLAGTDATIGYYTALDTALDAIDKIRDTAEAFDRVFLIEVMGRKAGFIALGVGIAGGAEEILVPEIEFSIDELSKRLQVARERGKGSYIIVVAEGACEGGAEKVAADLEKAVGIPTRVCVLGHIQRGGSPTSQDRVLATHLGACAVDAVIEGATGVMIGMVNNKPKRISLREAWSTKNAIDPELLRINERLII
jgi:6-phosphofructokinase 1